MVEEPQNSSIPTPRFNQGLGTLNPLYNTGGTYSHNGMIDYPIYPISKMHFGKFPDSVECQNWKVNFKTEVCARSAFPHITMQWINKVEIAKSIHDLLTSQSMTRGRYFTDFEMPDAMIADAFKKVITSVHFRRRIGVEEQRAQQYDRFLRGRQIAYMIYEYFRATGAYEAVQGSSDLFSTRLQRKWHSRFRHKTGPSSLAASEIPSETVLEGLYKLQSTRYCSASDCIGFVQGTHWEHQDTFLKVHLNSKTWALVFLQVEANWYRQHCGTMRRIEKRTAESYNTNSTLCHEVLDLESSVSYRRNVSSKMLIEKIRGVRSRTCISENSVTPETSSVRRPNFKSEVCSVSGCPTIAMFWRKRSEGGQISGRSHDVTVKRRAWLPWFWNAGCEGSVCIEEDHLQSVLPKKSQCQRAACSEKRQISSRKTDC